MGVTIESVASGTSPKLRIKSPASRTGTIEFWEGGSLKSSIWHSTDDSLNFNVNSGGDNALSIASNKNATFAGDLIVGTHNSNSHRLEIESRHASVPFGQIVAGSADNNQAVGFQFVTRNSNGDEINRMYLTSTGLGIGTNAPASSVQIAGVTGQDGLRVYNRDGGIGVLVNQYGTLLTYNGYLGTSSSSIPFYFQTGGTTRLTLSHTTATFTGDVNIEPAGGSAGLWLKSTNSHANIRMINNNGATNTIDEWKIQSNTNHDLKFYNANSEKVTFSSDGDATFAGDLDASSGQSLTGWHTQDKIWVMPSDFMPSTGRNEYNIAMVDNGGEAKTMHGAVSGYVNIPIPSGYKVTHYRLNGTASVEIKAYYSDCTTATATTVMNAPRYTNYEYATTSDVEANDTTGRYMILRWNCTSTSHRLYGGYVKIAKI